jgi:hypothetical protein
LEFAVVPPSNNVSNPEAVCSWRGTSACRRQRIGQAERSNGFPRPRAFAHV